MAADLQVQSILFNNDPEGIHRALQSLARAAELAVTTEVFRSINARLGDCSARPCLSQSFVKDVQEQYAQWLSIDYIFFNSNLGSAKGHNTLATYTDAAYLLIQNPDVVVSPRLLEDLAKPFQMEKVGMVEAKQLPIEHPKEYDAVTGDTLWATTACALIPNALFRELKGFDNESFFLYCDDVDFAWRVRLAGFRVIFSANAVVFHDKRLSDDGKWAPTSSEEYYSAEASMLLAHKWSRADLASDICSWLSKHGTEPQKKAADEFIRRTISGQLAPQLDPEHKIAYFADHKYAKHRYAL